MDADKKRLWVSGQFVEVTDEVYGRCICPMGCRHRITAEYGKHGKERGFGSSLFAFYIHRTFDGFLDF